MMDSTIKMRFDRIWRIFSLLQNVRQFPCKAIIDEKYRIIIRKDTILKVINSIWILRLFLNLNVKVSVPFRTPRFKVQMDVSVLLLLRLLLSASASFLVMRMTTMWSPGVFDLNSFKSKLTDQIFCKRRIFLSSRAKHLTTWPNDDSPPPLLNELQKDLK